MSAPVPRRTVRVAVLTLPAGSVAVTWIVFVPAAMGTIAENAPLPSAAPLTVAFVVVFLMLIVLRPWVWPTIVALLAFTTPLFFGEVIVIRGLLVSRM